MAFNLAKFGNEKLKKLEDEFKKHLSSKKEKPKRKAQKKIPASKIDSPETMTKRDFENLEKGIEKLKEFERELDSLDTSRFSVEAASIRAKLKDVSKIPIIEKEMRLLKLKLKEKERKFERKEIKIDSEINSLVDVDFNDFLAGLKTAFSQKIRKREQEVEEALNHDLMNRDKKYRQKHLELMQEFYEKRKKLEKDYENKYKMDVRINLQKEVEEKFKRLLNQRLGREKSQMIKILTEKLREEEKRKIAKSKDEMLRELRADKEGLKKEREKFVRALQIERDELEKEKRDFASNKEQERKKMRENLAREFKANLHKELDKRIKEIEGKLRAELEAEYKKKLQEKEESIQAKLKQILR